MTGMSLVPDDRRSRPGPPPFSVRGRLALIGVSSTMDSLVALSIPFVLGRTVDVVMAGHGYGHWFALLAGLIVVGVVGDVIGVFARTSYAADSAAGLRRRLIGHLLDLGPDRARRYAPGDLVARVSANAADAVQSAPAIVLITTAVFVPAVSLALLISIDPWLGVAFVAGVSVMALVLRAFTRRTSDIVARYQQVLGRSGGRRR